MKRNLCFLYCLLLMLSARSATITGSMYQLLGDDASNTVVNISGKDLPTYYKGKTYLSTVASTQLTNGQLNITIEPPGRFDLSFYGKSTTLRIVVPANTNTYDISSMLTNVTVYVVRQISAQLIAGTNVMFTTNNAGLSTEQIIVDATGGSSANAFFANSASAVWDSLNGSNRVTVLGFQPANANLTNWAGVAASFLGVSNLFGFMPQPTNANLTAWSLLATSAKQDVSANLTSWSAIVPNYLSISNLFAFMPQPTNANLTLWSALPPATKLDVTGNGSSLTALNASQLTSGTIPLDRLPSAVITNNFPGTFSLSNLNVSGIMGIATVVFTNLFTPTNIFSGTVGDFGGPSESTYSGTGFKFTGVANLSPTNYNGMIIHVEANAGDVLITNAPGWNRGNTLVATFTNGIGGDLWIQCQPGVKTNMHKINDNEL